MNADEVNRNWPEQKAKLKSRFGYIADKELFFEKGDKDEIIIKLQIKLGKTKYELTKIIESL